MHSSVLLRKFRRASALGYLVGALPVSSGGGFGSKAELGVGAGSFAPHGGEYAEVAVDVVVDFDAGLAGVGAQDAADVLDHAAFEGGARGKVCPAGGSRSLIADVAVGGDDEQRRPVTRQVGELG